jgi:predicted ester cyclase
MGEADPALATVRRLISDVWNDGRLDLLPELYADAFDHDGGRGSIDELVEWHRSDAETWADTRYEVVQEVSDGERVAVHWIASARHIGPWGPVPPTGTTISWPGVHFFRVADGRISEVVALADRLSKALALGVQMAPPQAP